MAERNLGEEMAGPSADASLHQVRSDRVNEAPKTLAQ
jgi:hypothetical protein